jgi:hypothetical protein
MGDDMLRGREACEFLLDVDRRIARGELTDVLTCDHMPGLTRFFVMEFHRGDEVIVYVCCAPCRDMQLAHYPRA